MAKKYNVTLHWVPNTPGKQQLQISGAKNSDQAQEEAASLARSIFPELTNGQWCITDVEDGDLEYVPGNFAGDMYGTEFSQPYVVGNSWESNVSSTYGVTDGLVSMDSYDSSSDRGSNMGYTPYGTDSNTDSNQASEDAFAEEAEDVNEYVPYSSQGNYKTYASTQEATSSLYDDSYGDDGDEGETYTPYTSAAQPASSSEEEGVTASQAAGYTPYFPGTPSGSSTGGATSKAYYTEIGNGYSPYRAFRVSVKKGTKIIV